MGLSQHQFLMRDNRINTLDVIRGFAVLGILLMNIVGFGLPHAYYDPTISGGYTGANFWVWWISMMFFEGTMRGLFTMLFGASLILFLNKASKEFQGIDIATIYFRRLFWLLIFGIIHCYLLLWSADMLYPYAIVGTLLFALHQLKAKYLILIASVFILLNTGFNILDYTYIRNTQTKSTSAKEKLADHIELSDLELTAIAEWEKISESRKPSNKQIDSEIVEYNKGYWDIVKYKFPKNQSTQSLTFYKLYFWDIFPMILLGMALLKTGFILGNTSMFLYLKCLLVGYGFGLTINWLEIKNIVENNYSILSQSLSYTTYDLGKIFTTLGHISLLMLFIKSNLLTWFQRIIAVVGQTSLSNYVLQTIICNILFLGFGFGLYAKLERYELYFIVFGIWLFQLFWSSIWMNYFRFGPFEWMWKSLIYWRFLPFLKK